MILCLQLDSAIFSRIRFPFLGAFLKYLPSSILHHLSFDATKLQKNKLPISVMIHYNLFLFVYFKIFLYLSSIKPKYILSPE